jgi:hypothetical protein
VADADPLDLAVAHSVADRIERIGNQPEYVRDADLFERVNREWATVSDIYGS